MVVHRPGRTIVTGTTGLAAHSSDTSFTAAAVVLVGLVGAWALVAVRTAHAVLTGQLIPW
ncbi:hypothetical protein [Modestobacter lacusdianchii]